MEKENVKNNNNKYDCGSEETLGILGYYVLEVIEQLKVARCSKLGKAIKTIRIEQKSKHIETKGYYDLVLAIELLKNKKTQKQLVKAINKAKERGALEHNYYEAKMIEIAIDLCGEEMRKRKPIMAEDVSLLEQLIVGEDCNEALDFITEQIDLMDTDYDNDERKEK